MPKNYKVTAVMRLAESVDLQAESVDEALNKVKEKYYKGEMMQSFANYAT